MSVKLEPERRFLLKTIPCGIKPLDTLYIRQFYTADKVRFRMAVSEETGDTNFFRTVKEKTDTAGVNLEDEIEIDEREFHRNRIDFDRYVFKQRSIVPAEGELKWEVDRFQSVLLVIAEIELPTIDHAIVLPKWLEEVKIMEVTGIPEFSNYRLSLPCS